MVDKQAFFHPLLILRAPALPFQNPFSEPDLRAWADSRQGQEALSLASADFLRNLSSVDGPLPRSLRRTLTNYFVRAHSRTTPFGLFAGCGVTEWGASTALQLQATGLKRYARPDMEWLRRLTQYLEQDVFRQQLLFLPNTSLHVIGQQIRYIDVTYQGTEKHYALRSADLTPELNTVLERCRLRPATLADLTQLLIARGFGADESEAYLEALVEAQVLESGLTPNVTGEPYFDRVWQWLQELSTNEAVAPIKQWFGQLRDDYDTINREQTTSQLALYEAIRQRAHRIPLPFEENKLIQVDVRLAFSQSMVSRQFQASLLEGVDVLRILNPVQPNADLEAFREAFYKQYEERFVPLTEVLDVDNGLGFPVGTGRFYSPLAEQLNLTPPPSDQTIFRQRAIGRHLYDRLREAEQTGQTVVNLTPAELQSFPTNTLPLPPSATMTFRLLPDNQILLEGLSGGSGLNLLTRFAHADEHIHALCTDLVQWEEAANPNVIFAEIVHLPEDRVGNILLRPAFRSYEIPYLAASGVDPAFQIRFDELLVGVRRNRIVLYCERLRKEIIPRLSSAQNFRRVHLPLFRFLCELKTQGLFTNATVDWTTLVPPRPFYPRLTYRNLVLSPARWVLSQNDLKPLLDAPEVSGEVFAAWAGRRRLPRFFVWTQGDNELLLDCTNLLTIHAWLDSVKKLETIELKEYLLSQGEDCPLRDEHNRPHAHQLMATVVNPATVYAGQTPEPATAQPLRRFWPGSEWFYCKIYCGWNVKKQVLHTWLVPFVQELQQKNIGHQWFFINYADPEPHIRLRVRLQTPDFMTEVYRILIESSETRDIRHLVGKIQIDTYERELERYEPHLIEQAEWLFWQDSEAVVALAVLSEDDPTGPHWLQWLRGVDFWLECADFSLSEKLQFAERMVEAFGAEFPPTSDNRRQLNDLYRQHRSDVDTLLTTEPGWMLPLRRQESARRTMLRQVRSRSADFQKLMSSYIHMFLNRLNPVEQRLHEFTYYYFLTKAYRTRLVLEEKQKMGHPAGQTHFR